jgi:hypothetical protein
MSYTLPALKMHLDHHYRPQFDFILLTGTSGENTEPGYRGRLLSALTIDLTRSYRTEEIVPPESWQRAKREYPGQWEFSLGVFQAWTFVSRPSSVEILPRSYSLMGQYPYRGSVLEIGPEEREMILGLEIEEESLPSQPVMKPALTLLALKNDRVLNEESVRIAGLVFHRVNASGKIQTRVAPDRTAMPPPDLILLVAEQLRQQPLCCALCGGLMLLRPQNKLLQASPDRKDSASGSYGRENFQLGHLACNLAKNDATEAQFQVWLDIASGRPRAGKVATDID